MGHGAYRYLVKHYSVCVFEGVSGGGSEGVSELANWVKQIVGLNMGGPHPIN